MSSHRKPIRKVAGALFAVAAASLWLVNASNATGSVGKEDLSGPWFITLVGDTGCGASTMLATGTLDNFGNGTFTLHGHSGCGNTTSTEKFSVLTMNANGSGTASLSCNNNNGCGWQFKIQVAPDRTVFSLVDITDVGTNLLMGTAIHQ